MKIKGENPETGEEYEAEADHVDDSFVDSMLNFKLTDEDIKRLIDNLNISADAKSLLYAFSKATIRAGQFVLKIGRKIIDFVCLLFKEYPSATFGMIFGAIVGFLVSSIPVLGMVLGPIATSIAMALGLVLGLKEDLKDKALVRRVAEINAKFSPLNV
jgi:hypothetical protein